MSDKFALGSDKISYTKVLYLVLLFGLMMFLNFMTANTTSQAVSLIYTVFGVGALVFVTLDIVIQKKEALDTVTVEPRDMRPGFLKNISGKWLILIIIAIFMFNAISITQTRTSLITAPTFETIIVEQGSILSGVLSGVAGIIEDLLFWGVLFPTVGSLIGFGIRNKFIGLLIAFIIVPVIFTGFHYSVYGFADTLASMATLWFGFVNCGLVLLFRNLLINHTYHFSNNLIATIFSVAQVGRFL